MPRTIQITAYGGPEQMHLVDLPVGEPGPGQIRIRHQAGFAHRQVDQVHLFGAAVGGDLDRAGHRLSWL